MSTLVRVVIISIIAVAPGGIFLLLALAIKRLWTKSDGEEPNRQILPKPAI